MSVQGIKRANDGMYDREKKRARRCTSDTWDTFQEEVSSVDPMDLTLSKFYVTNYQGLQVMFKKIEDKKQTKKAWRNLAMKTIWESQVKGSKPRRIQKNKFYDWIFEASRNLDQFVKKNTWAKDVLRIITKSKFCISKPTENLYNLSTLSKK